MNNHVVKVNGKVMSGYSGDVRHLVTINGVVTSGYFNHVDVLDIKNQFGFVIF